MQEMMAVDWADLPKEVPLAVLVSGGLDSAVLLGLAAQRQRLVQPIYIRCGLCWETVELSYLRHFLQALDQPSLRPVVILDLPVADLYDRHWSLDGRNVPGAASADDAVYLPGRNVLLLSKALLWCHLHQVCVLALGTLRGNPFADATPTFMQRMADLVNQACQAQLRVLQPLRLLDKSQVLALGRHLPLRWTFSCIAPQNHRHCGRCNKCAERQRAFAQCALPDPTEYATEPSNYPDKQATEH
ncbi:7-cyano-7-deazaguanine synthase [bacterium HR36]|nr:7-cyano-7-deazaguanine synthase [bacterium HR36]